MKKGNASVSESLIQLVPRRRVVTHESSSPSRRGSGHTKMEAGSSSSWQAGAGGRRGGRVTAWGPQRSTESGQGGTPRRWCFPRTHARTSASGRKPPAPGLVFCAGPSCTGRSFAAWLVVLVKASLGWLLGSSVGWDVPSCPVLGEKTYPRGFPPPQFTGRGRFPVSWTIGCCGDGGPTALSFTQREHVPLCGLSLICVAAVNMLRPFYLPQK